MNRLIALTTLLATSSTLSAEESGKIQPSEILVVDPSFAELIDPTVKVEDLAEGFGWAEGPVWDHKNKQVLFTDVPGNRIHAWSPKNGLTTFMEPSGFTGLAEKKSQGANGLTFDAKGQLTLCEHGDRRVSVLTEHGGKMTVVDQYDGKRFNSPNDLVFHSDGSLYFTDPCFGLKDGEKSPDFQSGCNGVYRMAPDKSVSLLVSDLHRPNGLCFSLDEKTLYVANSYNANILMAYPVKDDGSLAAGKVLFDFTELAQTDQGGADGVRIDEKGNLWCTGPGGVNVISPVGKLLGRIKPGSRVANLCWGDDGHQLYLTAHKKLLRLKTIVKAGRW